jgi:DNA polymerase III epsilon subunit-like protein
LDNAPYSDRYADGSQPETYISVDVETAGPVPSLYSLLSIGACLVEDPAQGFYVELKPDRPDFQPQALAVCGLSMERLEAEGQPPRLAMDDFADWLKTSVPQGHRPVFTAFNAPFDWMFVNDYFFRYLGRNPFGHTAIDIKAFYMGHARVPWSRTSMRWLAPQYLAGRSLTHNALADARDQAELFRILLAEQRARGQDPSEGRG